MDYGEAIDYLYGLQFHGIKLGLDNPRRLLASLGEPHTAFRSIHIAGTNGKGSTAAMLASMLQNSGLRTGLFTSPHLVSFTERIRVDGDEITPAEVVSLTAEIRAAAEGIGLSPTFFEVVTAMGFLYFKRVGVQVAVVETGMGGRLDATNVLAPDVTVITPIGMDHAGFLGSTVTEIASEKAGIIKKGIPVVASSQGAAQMDVIRKKAEVLYVYGEDFSASITHRSARSVRFNYHSVSGLALSSVDVALSGAYQAENAAVAIKAMEVFSGPSDPARFEQAVRRGLSALRWPGRLELISTDPQVIIDGAHNPPAAEALARAFREDFMGSAPWSRGFTLVMGVMADKDAAGIMRPLLPLAMDIIFTAPAYGRAAPPEDLVRLARNMGYEAASSAPVGEALMRAMALGRPVLVTGSFYTAGAAKEALGGKGFEIGLRE